eukprot:1160249-Pelagomonas_calceolata.AAC.4
MAPSMGTRCVRLVNECVRLVNESMDACSSPCMLVTGVHQQMAGVLVPHGRATLPLPSHFLSAGKQSLMGIAATSVLLYMHRCTLVGIATTVPWQPSGGPLT